MTDRKRVLVISYFYPPFSTVGAVRVSKETRYLADHGWDATVITTKHDDRAANLPLEIPAENIHRVDQAFDVLAPPRALVGRKRAEAERYVRSADSRLHLMWRLAETYRHVACFPDPHIGWRRPAIDEGLRLIDTLKPHAILTSSLPNTSHLVGAALAKKTGVPWIAEFRDLWTDNHNFKRFGPLRAIERRLEAHTLAGASALVTVSPAWADLLHRRFDKPAYVVANGYDPNDYPAPEPARVFTLAYTGMFYDGKQNAAPLAEAIANLAAAGEITPENFRVNLVGHYLLPIMAAADRAGILPFVTLDPPVPHTESLRRQVNATALIFFDWFFGAEKGWLSAKIYEYLGARRPIVSVGPRDSAVAALLAKTGAGRVGSSSAELEAILRRWLAEFRATGTVMCATDPLVLAGYQRQSAAAALADVLNRHGRG